MGYKLKMAGISVALATAFAVGTGVGSVYVPQPSPDSARYLDLHDDHTFAEVGNLCMEWADTHGVAGPTCVTVWNEAHRRNTEDQ